MNASRQEIIATLRFCAPIYHRLFEKLGYHLTKDDLGCLEKFDELWSAALLPDETMLKEAGMSYEEYGFLIGYVYELKIEREEKAK